MYLTRNPFPLAPGFLSPTAINPSNPKLPGRSPRPTQHLFDLVGVQLFRIDHLSRVFLERD